MNPEKKINSLKINGETENSSIQDLVKRIEEFKNLESNWDTYEADKVSINSISNAIQTVKTFERNNIIIDYAFPMSDGGVQLEKNFKGYNIEIEVQPGNEMKLLVFDKNNNLIFEKDFMMNNLDNLIAKVREYYGELHHSGTR